MMIFFTRKDVKVHRIRNFGGEGCEYNILEV